MIDGMMKDNINQSINSRELKKENELQLQVTFFSLLTSSP